MPATILVGAQWGDEGKGRVADWLAAESDIVARYGGGDNAGHTVYVGDQVFKLHMVPSGILHERVVCVLGNGMVINPVNLVKEIEHLAQMGVPVEPARLLISARAHLITPAHIALDRASEQARGSQAIGTTLRGIGPAYLDKTGRRGIRAGEMLEADRFAERLRDAIKSANQTLAAQGMEPLDVEQAVEPYCEAAARLKPYIADTAVFLYERLRAGARVLCEGAQGTLLDVDHGSYPFVTSSSPTAGGALTGLGIGPGAVDRVVGAAKCFSTRVGSGPMPTELHDEVGDRLRGTGEHFWDEYGTTTGRPRRCGWLDGVMLRYAAAINGFTELVLTKLDVLSGFTALKLAVAYRLDGQTLAFPPAAAEALERVEPIYETLPGWQENLSQARQAADLPEAALQYIQRIAALCEVPVSAVSVGPERDQLVRF